MEYLPNPGQIRRMHTEELRRSFLITGLFTPGAVTLRQVDLDRAIVGGAVPTDASLVLEPTAALAADYFTERREIGVLNIGGPGCVRVDGATHALGSRDGLYVGRGGRKITFSSDDAKQPARFYLISYPAHLPHPTTAIARADAAVTDLGDVAHANRRAIRKYIHADGIRSAQLLMGTVELAEGSVWNTMPPHTHARRTEIYLYFDLPEDAAVFHFLGEPREIRSLIVRDGEVALSPAWSIHAGCGTTRYSFCWSMGGENQEFSDMQVSPIADLR